MGRTRLKLLEQEKDLSILMRDKIIESLWMISDMTASKAMRSICGPVIGFGIHREVRVFKPDPRYVVKLDVSDTNFANVAEWLNWVNFREWRWLARWLAPCQVISHNGRVLIQTRIDQDRNKKFPERLPRPLTDIKRDNFGWIGNQFVCCDYSTLIASSKREMRKVRWDKHKIAK